MINLDNVYFVTADKTTAFFKMSKESLDDFLEETPLNLLKGYKEAEIHLTVEDSVLKDATLTCVYEAHKGQCIDVKALVDPEVVEYAIEEMAEDRESFDRNLSNFYKWDITEAKLKEVKQFAEEQFDKAGDIENPEEPLIVVKSKRWGVNCCNPWIDSSARFVLSDQGAKEEWGEEIYNQFIIKVLNHLYKPE